MNNWKSKVTSPKIKSSKKMITLIINKLMRMMVLVTLMKKITIVKSQKKLSKKIRVKSQK